MLRASGLQDDDFKKPLVGVANTWIEIVRATITSAELAQHVKEGIRAAGELLWSSTLSPSDGITMARKACDLTS